jgi:hypothetical protein
MNLASRASKFLGWGGRLEREYGSSLSPDGVKGRPYVGVDVPDAGPAGVLAPADPDGLTSLEGGNESPVGPTVKVGGCFGCAPTTPDTSDTEDGRGEGCGDCLGERDTTTDCGLLSLLCTVSIDVGGGS